MDGRRKEKMLAIPRCAPFNRYNILSTGLVGLAKHRPSLAPSLSLAVPSCTPVHAEKEKGSECARSNRSIARPAFFRQPPTIDPIPASTGGRSDAPAGSQGGANALSSFPPPSVQTFDSPHERSTHLPPAIPPRSFCAAASPFRFSLAAGEASAGNPKKWIVDFRRCTRGGIPPACRARERTSERCVGCSEGRGSIRAIRMDTQGKNLKKVSPPPVIINVNRVNGRDASDNFERGRLTRREIACRLLINGGQFAGSDVTLPARCRALRLLRDFSAPPRERERERER